ncbi:hypothetical protein [Streptomyces sp. NBC_00467]|uniref:hypothetical protein n=1 Tax=Streptomyces sp. NBC_00467 TaxID=2975752 RepID=UPI002E17CEC9
MSTALSVRRPRGVRSPGGRARPAAEAWQRTTNAGLPARAGVLLAWWAGTASYRTSCSSRPPPTSRRSSNWPREPPPGNWPSIWVSPTPRAGTAASPGPAGGRRSSRTDRPPPGGRRRTDLRRYHASSIAPPWPQVRADGPADRTLRSEVLLRGGVEALLTTPGPNWR